MSDQYAEEIEAHGIVIAKALRWARNNGTECEDGSLVIVDGHTGRIRAATPEDVPECVWALGTESPPRLDRAHTRTEPVELATTSQFTAVITPTGSADNMPIEEEPQNG